MNTAPAPISISAAIAPKVGTIAADMLLVADCLEVMGGSHDFADAATPKKKNCNPAKSHFCVGKKGAGACFPLTKKCAIAATGSALQVAEGIASQKPEGGQGFLNVADVIKADAASLLDGDQKPTPPVAGNPSPLSGKSDAALKKASGDFMVSTKDPWTAQKVAKMKKYDLTTAEAAAVASWISQEYTQVPGGEYKTKYSLMNQAVYAKDSLPPALQAQIEAANELAIRGYQKLPSITPESVAAKAAAKYADFDPAAPLQKHIQISNDPAGFIQKYQDAIGGEISEDTHFGTTHKSSLPWVENKSNITYQVTPKWDGTGRGKYIDDLKNNSNEGEIMFIPGTKFKVKGVVLPNSSTPPAKPDTIADDATLANIQNAVAEAQMGGGGWKANYKATHGKAAFDALPAAAKAVNSKKALNAMIESNKAGLAAHKAAMDAYSNAGQSNRYIIQLEEI